MKSAKRVGQRIGVLLLVQLAGLTMVCMSPEQA